MALITAKRVSKNNKKGTDFYKKAVKYSKENFSDFAPKNEKEINE